MSLVSLNGFGLRLSRSVFVSGVFALGLGVTIAVPPALAADDLGTWDDPKLIVEACVGDTTFDPEYDSAYDVEVNLLGLWGERYDAYQRGDSVPLYGYNGSGGASTSPPLCVVRKGEDETPVSAWSYCTDRTSPVCGSYDLEGNTLNWVNKTPDDLDDLKDIVGAQVSSADPNEKLSPEQLQALAYLLSNDVTIPESAWIEGWMEPASSEIATDRTELGRQARQFLTWCITDPEDYGWWNQDTESYDYPFCEIAMPKERQARLASLVGESNTAELNSP